MHFWACFCLFMSTRGVGHKLKGGRGIWRFVREIDCYYAVKWLFRVYRGRSRTCMRWGVEDKRRLAH